MTGAGNGPDECVVCGADASDTLGRTCSSECAKRSAGLPKRIGWRCDLCGYSSTAGDAHDDVVEHICDQHADHASITPSIVRSVGLANVHWCTSRITVERDQHTLADSGITG